MALTSHSLPVLIALTLSLAATTTQAQVPEPAPNLHTEWRRAAVAIEHELTASVIALEDTLRAAQIAQAWTQVDCGLVRLASLRTLRDSVSEAAAKIDAAARAGQAGVARHHWQSIVASRLHGEVLTIEAAECGEGAPLDDERVVVRVTGPAWDADGEYGAPRVPGAPVALALAR